MRTAGQSVLNSDINVTPLVDVCLVLLIIFMVITPVIVTGVPVQLPTAGTAEPLARQPLQISVMADGTLFIGSTVAQPGEAGTVLARVQASGDRPVVVQADKSLNYGKVLAVLDLCRRAGFTRVGLAAQKLED